MSGIKLTQRDMLLQVYNAVCGNGSPGLIEKVDRIEQALPKFVTHEECHNQHVEIESDRERRMRKAGIIMGIVLPTMSMIVVICLKVFG